MNKEELKEKISWYRHLFTFLAAVNFACISWFVANYGKYIIGFYIIDVLAIIFSYIIMFVLAFKIKKHIKKLGED